MAKIIYLNSRSDIPSITKLLRQVKESEVVLVVPKNTRLFRFAGKLRQLSKIAGTLGKKITIATTSLGGRRLALHVGFRVIKGKEMKLRVRTRLVGDLVFQKKVKQTAFGDLPKLVKRVLPTAPGKKSILKISKPRAVIVVIVVLVLTGVMFYALPSATITVVTRSEPVTRDVEIEVRVDQLEPDLASLTVPGRIIEQEVEGSKSFTPTGRRNIGKKASGFVQIYNLSKTTLILRAETTVLSIGGESYVFTQDVGGIRPTAFIGQGEDQEIDPSSLIAPVPVVALTAGEASNLTGGSRIEITNEVFGAKPEELYAEAAGNITGGSTLEIKVVSETDILQALEAVQAEIIDQAAKDLTDESEGAKLLESAVSSEILEQSVSHQPGDQTGQFSAAVKISLKALVYDENDIIELVRNRVERLLPENKKLISEEESFLRSRFFVTNLELGTGVLTNHFESRIVYLVDGDELKRKVSGKSEDEIRELLLSRPEIESVEVSFSPFWVKSAPRLVNRIRIDNQ